ncbi:hypothetical protein QMK33_11755 [Hymenobacter sp. H14-R3]|uniref:hypothetical protein n=1 Tax=Hymenobacter sp. H14-R3 TaxID=3046308 RepID=UPI0024BA3DEA|nr:hypothetical protein [Hymenobacter sp. H14-R3]MDJ0365828.1 hypothetical protein [Hymenobacter sp. H14-R3]
MTYFQKTGISHVPKLGPGRGLLLLACVVLAACAGYAALVLYSASWPEAAGLRQFYHWAPRAYTVAEFLGLRRGLAALAGGATLLAWGLGRGGPARAGGAALRREVGALCRRLGAGWAELRPGQRWLASGLLLALTGLRVYYSFVLVPGDDAVSYEVFVRGSLLRVSAAYPLPNNHVLSNTLDWVFYQLYPGFWWSMRLPVLLASTAATVGWFLLLLRRSSFRIALLAVSLFSSTQLAFYHSATGRGYSLLCGLGGIGFFAVLELAASVDQSRRATGRRQQVAWAALVGSGVVGLYVVPTHAYFLLSAYSWLALVALAGRAWGLLGRAVGLGLLTLVGAALLYAPLLLLSGAGLLFHNEFVVPLPVGEFWRVLPRYLWFTEGWLSGHRWLGVGPLLLVLLGFALQWRRAATGRLPAATARLVRGLGLPGVWFLVAPYLLVLGQRVQSPERTLYYKAQLMTVVAAMLIDWGLRQPAAGLPRRRALQLLAVGSLAFAGTQLFFVERNNRLQQGHWVRYLAGGQWLSQQPPGPVLAPEPLHRFLLRFYVHSQLWHQPWQVDDRPRPGVHYRYLVSMPGAQRVPYGPAVAGPPAYHDGLLDIFVAP